MKQNKLHAEVRFHLSSGENYRKWQVKIMKNSRKAHVFYFDPNEVQLELIGCKLINKVGKAKQVYEAGVKDVSGWIKCDDFVTRGEFWPLESIDNLEKLYYNPIRDVHWRRESDCGEFDWDNSEYATLITQGKQVYILEERT